MANKIVSNTGPIIHLNEINFLKALDVFSDILIPEEVANELRKNKISILSKIKIVRLTSESKDKAKIITNEHNLDLGEAEAITLALQEKIDYFITDDLEARQIAKKYFIETHGTIGVILRMLKTKLIDKKTAIEKINELKTKSSLFITQDLINEVIKAINEFK
ncbi:DUF3368 domain-containing protein [Candidatus Pacearchaeota archaeon]|nr:hypothetical protein [uncultured archaeon]MBS3092907.1 DUF3368 domain-containing protein [Candidatus Pacearchaeota archaeon]